MPCCVLVQEGLMPHYSLVRVCASDPAGVPPKGGCYVVVCAVSCHQLVLGLLASNSVCMYIELQGYGVIQISF